jgi:O-antigen ligase
MHGTTERRKFAVLVGVGLVAVLLGLAVTSVEAKWLGAGLVGLVSVALVFRDYRVGVVCLTVLLPWSYSPLLPQTQGFNLINFLMLASVVSLLVHRSFQREPVVPLPRVVWWCYLLPVAVGVVVAWPHLSQGAANFPPEFPGEQSMFTPVNFLKSRVVKPMFFVLYAFLLGNAVRDSERPERLLIPFVLSALAPAVSIMIYVAAIGGDVLQRDTLLQGLGLHANEYGMQLALAAGPLLYLAVGAGSRLTRTAAGLAFCAVSVALALTSSRGAATAYGVVLAVWLLQRRKFTDLLLGLALVVVLAAAVPAGVWDRLTLGLDDIGASTTHNTDDPLTKGRLSSWYLLAPELLDSPVWGSGIASTAWNSATTTGRYTASHPHNLYLEILLDLGVLGFVAVMYLLYRYGRAFRVLSNSSGVPPVARDFFRGAFASFLGMAAMAMTNGHWMPHPEQAFLWFGLGLAFGYWHLVDEARNSAERRSPPAYNQRSEFSSSRQIGGSP